MSYLLFVLLGVGGYAISAGVAREIIMLTFDTEHRWNGYDFPGKTEMSWLWPITVLCVIGYWVGFRLILCPAFYLPSKVLPALYKIPGYLVGKAKVKREQSKFPKARVVK